MKIPLLRCLPGLQRVGFHFGATVAQNFVRVMDRFAVRIVRIFWEKIDDVA